MRTSPTSVGFIGAGRMAEALIARLPKPVIASDINQERLRFLRRKYRIRIARNNSEAFAAGSVVILAVKPQQMSDVLAELENSKIEIRNSKLVISIAAGIPLKYLEAKLHGYQIVRAMPNNPALIGQGITAIAKGSRVTHYALRITKQIFASVGEVVEVPEKLMDAVTGLSGSGPAFVYETVSALAAGGVSAGLPKAVAEKLALQTVIGAAATAKATGRGPAELIAQVASPGGTTLEGLKVLEQREFSKTLAQAVLAAAEKSAALARKWAQ